MKYGLIGERLGHSFSKEIHGAIGDYPYILREIDREDLKTFMEEKGFLGINVTIPYKVEVMKYLDRIDERAKAIGAVNTVVNRDGVLYGYNTDIDGMISLIHHAGIELEGRKVLILGTGGTSRTAAEAARILGASSVIKAGRTSRRGNIDYEEARRDHGDARIIINTTPAGMYPEVEGCATDTDSFDELEGVIDAVYNPLRTDLILRARERGIKAEGGLYMLVSQAVHAWGRFSGRDADDDITDRIYEDMNRKKENIVLTGMPGCGKTTSARILADHLGREMVDTDMFIIEKTGRYPADIIREDGTEKFRDIEEDAVAEISMMDGKIIATGGGTVLRPSNIRRLRRNGRIYFLDRDPSSIEAGGDRPLSGTRDDISRIYRERYSIYEESADAVIGIDDDGDASDIIEYFKGR